MAVKWPLAGLRQSWFNGRRCKLVCKTWSQPDGNHIRGLCTNELFAEGNSNNCSICVTPVDASVSGCGCPTPLKLRSIHYLRVETTYPYTPTFAPNTCWFDHFLGDFILYGTCGGATHERQVVSHATLGAPTPLPPCEIRTTTAPRWTFVVDGLSFVVGGKRFMPGRLRAWYAIAGYQGPPPYPIYEFGINPWNFSGGIPWCTNNRGSGTFTQENTGIFGATLICTLSTEPFT